MPLTAWTTHEELTADQRARFGEYVRAKDDFRRQCDFNAKGERRAREALAATGGDKLKALGLLLSKSQPEA